MNNMVKFKHVMLDCETLGLTPGSVVRTVSLVEFEPTTGKTGRHQTWIINLQDSIKAGFRIEAGSLKWWMMKEEKARKAFVSTPEEETTLVSFVGEFIEWFSQYNGKVVLWNLQVDFDTALIAPYLAHYYMYIMRNDSYELPWNRKLRVDVRPFMEIYKTLHPDIKTPHTSIDDCMLQIKAVAEVFKKKIHELPDDESLKDKILNTDLFYLTINGRGLLYNDR